MVIHFSSTSRHASQGFMIVAVAFFIGQLVNVDVVYLNLLILLRPGRAACLGHAYVVIRTFAKTITLIFQTSECL